MLISKEKIEEYLSQIPPIPEHVLNIIKHLNEGEIKKAALEADKDLVLKNQLKQVVNSAYFSISNKVEDTVQLFTMLGIATVKSILYSYLVSKFAPQKWSIFNIDFKDFQLNFLALYEEYVTFEFGEETYKTYPEIGAVIPVAVAVCDMLLGEKKEEIELLMQSAPLEYGTVIKRMTGETLFSIAAHIAKIWELQDYKCEVIEKAECGECLDAPISALVHFLFFYLASKPNFMDINSLIEFNPQCMEYIPKTTQRILNANQ